MKADQKKHLHSLTNGGKIEVAKSIWLVNEKSSPSYYK